jgi:hypothetical protein
MKDFNVMLRDGRSVIVRAESYHTDGDHYVFPQPGGSEVQFFVKADVIGISEVIPPMMPVASSRRKPRALDG